MASAERLDITPPPWVNAAIENPETDGDADVDGSPGADADADIGSDGDGEVDADAGADGGDWDADTLTGDAEPPRHNGNGGCTATGLSPRKGVRSLGRWIRSML